MKRPFASRASLAGAGLAYASLLSAIVLAARIGLFPGAGEVLPQGGILDQPYRLSMAAVGLVLAVYLGSWSGLIGLAWGSWRSGLVTLAMGGMVTVLALAAAPWFYYPNDQYPVAFMWLLGGAPIALATWTVVTLGARLPGRGFHDRRPSRAAD